MKNQDPSKARRRKIRRVVIVEIIFMSIGVLCVLLPLEWRLLTLVVLGARGIIVKAYAQLKQPIDNTGEYVGYGKEYKKEKRAEKREVRKRGKAQNANKKDQCKQG
ncbi:MAG: hypothetical protein ACI4MB_05770 [Candidatus Coproplasma sp.]